MVIDFFQKRFLINMQLRQCFSRAKPFRLRKKPEKVRFYLTGMICTTCISQFVPRKFSRKLGPCQCERTISPGILLIKRPLERNFCSKCQYLNSLQTSAFQPERQCVLMVRMINSCCVDDKHGADENHRTSNSIGDTETPSAWGIYKITFLSG